MLTKDLLVARRYRDKIHPRYVDPHSPEQMKRAERVLEVYHEHIGAPRERLTQQLEDLETHQNFKLARGLAQLLERRCLFEPVYAVEPRHLRRFLCQKGYVTGPQERTTRLKEAARALESSPEDLDDSFWADREEKQILQGFLPAGPLPLRKRERGRGPTETELTPVDQLNLSPEGLLRQYNLSLTQTLLFGALDLWFQASGNYQQIFRWIKYLGLMYEAVEELPGQVKVRVDGPASIFKETTKYGTSLAKLLPVLTRAETWQLVVHIKEKGTRYTFKLDHSKRALFPQQLDEVGEKFDSAVEQNFYQRIRAVMREWEVKREPTILRAGPHIFIPDFGFEHRGLRYYLEIVGFWTPEYLEKKLNKLKAADADLLVAVDVNLNCTEDDWEETGKEVFTYDKKLPLEPVIQKLQELAKGQKQRELKQLRQQKFIPKLEDDLIELAKLAQQYDVGVETMKEVLEKCLESGRIEGYHLIQDTVVSDRLLKELEDELDALPAGKDGGRDLKAVQDVLERYGLGQQALELVGYKVEWESLLETRVIRIR